MNTRRNPKTGKKRSREYLKLLANEALDKDAGQAFWKVAGDDVEVAIVEGPPAVRIRDEA